MTSPQPPRPAESVNDPVRVLFKVSDGPRAFPAFEEVVALWAAVAASWMMTGLIWFVQVVHYPLYTRVGLAEFPLYHADHARLTTWVVAPVMLVELVAAVVRRTSLTATWTAAGFNAVTVRQARRAADLGLALTLVNWVSTALIQVPLHGRLDEGFDAGTIAALVGSNWVRTVAWSLHAGVSLGLVIVWSRGGIGPSPHARCDSDRPSDSHLIGPRSA